MKRISSIVIVIICVFIINNLIHSIYTLWQKQDVLVAAQQDLQKAKQKNSGLKQQITQVKSPNFIEEQARDKLLLVKPGEDVVVVPPELIVGDKPLPVRHAPVKANWQQWWDLFFTHN